MHKVGGWLLGLGLLLAACAPVQVGLETGTLTPGVTVALPSTTAPPTESSVPTTSTARPPTVVVSTVTPSATVPTPTPSETASPVPPTATAPPTSTATLRVQAATRPPTATRVPPSATPTPTATSTLPLGTPEVGSFTADRTEANPGEPITLTWTTSNARAVRLHAVALDAAGALVSRLLAADLPSSGSLTVTLDDVAPAQIFRLEVLGATDAPGPYNQVSIRRRDCPETYAFFFPAGRITCAASASVLVSTVEQVFEHGRLLMVATNDWINPRSEPAIFVLNSSGGWVSRTNTWHPGEPESDPAIVPPAGFYQPVGSLGELWRDELRDQLGWALAPEQAYSGSLQYGWAPQPGAETGSPGWYAQDMYFRLANGDVVRLVWGSRFTGQTWELLPQ